MARKDVDFVIRAKDEAAKTLDAITAALNNFNAQQTDTVSGAAKTESALGKIGSSFDKLLNTLKGGGSSDAIQKTLNGATEAAKRLEAQVAQTGANLTSLKADAAGAAQAVSQFNQKTEESAAAVKAQSAALGKAKGDLAAQEQAFARATADRAKLIQADKNLSVEITAAAAKVAEAEQRYASLGAEMQKAAEPTKRLQLAFEASGRALEATKSRLAGLEETQAVVRTSMEKSAEAAQRFSNGVATAAAGIARQEQVLASTSAEYTANANAARSAGQQQKALEGAVRDTAAALDKQAAALDKAQTELASTSDATQKAQVALSALSAGSTAGLERQFKGLQGALEATRAEYLRLQTESLKARGGLDQIGPPTREQAVAFYSLTAAMNTAEKQFATQAGALNRLGGVMQQSAGSVAELAQREREFAAVQTTLAADMNKIEQEANQQSAGFLKLRDSIVAAKQAAAQMRDVDPVPDSARLGVLAKFYQAIYGESRQAMSMTQRLRGEVLSLVAAYGGIYGAINGLGQVLEATQKLEAAQTRLNGLYQGDTAKANEDMDFLRRTSDRLGLSLGDLADQYTKFAASTRGTNLEGEKTRKIFLSVASAARANNLSLDETQGVFTALTQIASKGKVQLEELTGQLGDRLPGALQIMADGLNTTTEELLNMTGQGEVTSDALVGFAQELDRRYGSQLAKSLEGTTAGLGKMGNAATQAFIAFGQAGFIDSFNSMIQALTETMKSADFLAFVQRVSGAVSTLIDVLTTLVQNFKLVGAAAGAIVGLKVAAVLLAFREEAMLLTKGLGDLRAGIALTGGVASGATLAFEGLGAAIKGVLISSGVGIAIVGITTALGYLLTSADDTTQAFVSQKDIIDQVRNAYELAAGSTQKFAQNLDKLSTARVNNDLTNLRSTLKDLETPPKLDAGGLFAPIYTTGNGMKAAADEFDRLNEAYAKGEMQFKEYQKAMDALSDATNSVEFTEQIAEALKFNEAIENQKQKIAELEAVLALKKDADDEAARAVLGLKDATDTGANAFEGGKTAIKNYTDALGELKKLVPGLAEDLKHLKEMAEIDEAFAGVIKNARSVQEVLDAYALRDRARSAANDNYANFERDYAQRAGTPAGKNDAELVQAVSKLAETMGLAAKDILAAMSFETGGTFDPWKAGPTTKYGQHRGLIQWGEPQREKYGVTQDSSITEQVEAAGKYLADAGVKAGDGLERIYAAILAGNANKTNASDLKAGGVVGNVSDTVRGANFDGHKKRAEGLLAAYGGDVQAAKERQKEIEKEDKAAEKKKADAEQFHKDQAISIEQQRQENALQDENLIKRETLKALQKAENEARQKGTELTAKERAEIEKNVRAQFSKQAAEEESNKKKKAAQDAEQKVNDLISQRTELLAQQKLYTEQGDTAKVEETQTKIAAINTELMKAIPLAQAMWKGLEGGDAANAKLATAALTTQKLSQGAQKNLVDWGRVGNLFADGLTNAFGDFAQQVANGEKASVAARKAFLKFAGDFLIQIGQMIMKQIILNALSALGKATGIPGLGAVGGAVAHGGGIVGGGNFTGRTRMVNPAIFTAAQRYHSGGFPGLKPDEVPAILQKGEEVLERSDARNALNGGLAANGNSPSSDPSVKVVNAFDTPSFLEAGLASRRGEKVLMNFVSANSAAINRALGK